MLGSRVGISCRRRRNCRTRTSANARYPMPAAAAAVDAAETTLRRTGNEHRKGDGEYLGFSYGGHHRRVAQRSKLDAPQIRMKIHLRDPFGQLPQERANALGAHSAGVVEAEDGV